MPTMIIIRSGDTTNKAEEKNIHVPCKFVKIFRVGRSKIKVIPYKKFIRFGNDTMNNQCKC